MFILYESIIHLGNVSKYKEITTKLSTGTEPLRIVYPKNVNLKGSLFLITLFMNPGCELRHY